MTDLESRHSLVMDTEGMPVQQSRKRKRDVDGDSDAQNREIMLLENQIRDSQLNYNGIKRLLKLAHEEGTNSPRKDTPATLALCRVFCRLHADGKLSDKPASNSNVAVIRDWLRERLQNYQALLVSRLSNEALARSSLDILLALLTEVFLNSEEIVDRRTGFFTTVLDHILEEQHPLSVVLCEDFAVKFIQSSNIARDLTFNRVRQFLRHPNNGVDPVPNALAILSSLKMPKDNQTESVTESFPSAAPSSAQKKNAQRAWLALLSRKLNKHERKKILSFITSCVIPWFTNVEILMDFLSDSFDEGGATSLLALEGLFYLMHQKNLDYPDFYVKLYSLLDQNVLHSKHRSRFFRLLETFMASTHLPAAMVASFIKRLSRLSLDAPPAGIVAVVPWIYNMLKTHPTCTFMIHREPRTEDERQDIHEYGVEDVFDMDETDPMVTNAIDSCLWEIETLQSHYHPNVASLAKIISEQFTKRSYNLEDFLNHSYNSLLDSELSRPLKKTPIVEYQIPKFVFRDAQGAINPLGHTITQALETS